MNADIAFWMVRGVDGQQISDVIDDHCTDRIDLVGLNVLVIVLENDKGEWQGYLLCSIAVHAFLYHMVQIAIRLCVGDEWVLMVLIVCVYIQIREGFRKCIGDQMKNRFEWMICAWPNGAQRMDLVIVALVFVEYMMLFHVNINKEIEGKGGLIVFWWLVQQLKIPTVSTIYTLKNCWSIVSDVSKELYV